MNSALGVAKGANVAKHTRTRTTEQLKRLEKNRQTLEEALAGARGKADEYTQTSGLTLVLERFAIERGSCTPVPYDGYTGLERILAELAKTYEGGQVVVDGHLMGLRGILAIEGRDEPVEISASVGVGAQLSLSVGPAASITTLLDALAIFDRQFHLACVALGHDVDLVAQGYNPYVDSPSDIVAVPLSRYALLNAYLSRTGRYTRDALRCTAATRILLPMASSEELAVTGYRVAAAIAPLLAFLTDNTLRMRGEEPVEAKRMIRTLVWDQVDSSRCGLAEGTFLKGFGFKAYERWLEGIRPIVFTSDDGLTFSTGSDTMGRLMEERDLSPAEALRTASMAFPQARWTGQLELACADALPPRLACGYAAFAKGLFASPDSIEAASKLLDLASIDEDSVAAAWHDLRELGWGARPYGRPIGQLADELANIAAAQLEDRKERQLLDGLAQLWTVHMVPRDSLLHNWSKQRTPTREERAIELYGEGAVIPYDELGGEPPAGKTSVMRVIRQEPVQ